jgi:DNA-binding LacI/PurR family transcriptional regulator
VHVSKKRPTLKDVAAAAGVGAMTVSYTFNQPARVAEGTRRRVLDAAERIGYLRPDSTARALRSGRTGQLGIVIGEHLAYAFDDPQARLFLAGVAGVCVEEGLGMVLIPTHGDDADVDRVLDAAVDAYVIWTTTRDDPVLDAVVRSGTPAAIQGGPLTEGIVCVAQDDRSAAAAVATEALGRVGTPLIVSFPLDRDRLGFVGRGRDLPTTVPFPVTESRLAGYRDALARTSHDWDATAVVVVERNGRHDAEVAVRTGLPDLPDGPLIVLAMSDELALGARDALAGTKRAATVTGWDATAEAFAAGVISVTNPLREQGRLCARAALGSDVDREVEWSIVTRDL